MLAQRSVDKGGTAELTVSPSPRDRGRRSRTDYHFGLESPLVTRKSARYASNGMCRVIGLPTQKGVAMIVVELVVAKA